MGPFLGKINFWEKYILVTNSGHCATILSAFYWKTFTGVGEKATYLSLWINWKNKSPRKKFNIFFYRFWTLSGNTSVFSENFPTWLSIIYPTCPFRQVSRNFFSRKNIDIFLSFRTLSRKALTFYRKFSGHVFKAALYLSKGTCLKKRVFLKKKFFPSIPDIERQDFWPCVENFSSGLFELHSRCPQEQL